MVELVFVVCLCVVVCVFVVGKLWVDRYEYGCGCVGVVLLCVVGVGLCISVVVYVLC